MELSLTYNADFVDSQYQRWRKDPSSVSREWGIFFEGFELAASCDLPAAGVVDKTQLLRQSRVEDLIHRYRDLGHLLACLDPLTSCPMDHPLLNLQAFSLGEEDLDRTFFTPHLAELEQMPLREILSLLRETYCRSIGVEYMHLQDPEERRWLQRRMEPVRNRPRPDVDTKLRILSKLMQASLFEQFLHTRYLGQKRFSLEGAEVVVAMLDALTQHVAAMGCREIVLGMAHRGRLNVQVNLLNKLYEAVFCEFEDSYDPVSMVGGGDVKYHGGYLANVRTLQGEDLRILLTSNPSHLDAVDPVVEGIVRARQDQLGIHGLDTVMPLLIHGDSAFAGQGVVAETLNLSQLQGYHTGGTIHLVINNQIGFTTLPDDARSTRYSTDLAKMLMVPIFHVHGENPEAAVHVMKLAADYRYTFHKDVVIDVVCYRRYGHNEGDEPYFTQPLMYDRIKERPPVYQLYADSLLHEGGILSKEDMDRMKSEILQCLEIAHHAARERACVIPVQEFYESWDGMEREYTHQRAATGVAEDILRGIAGKARQLPDGFSMGRKLERILDRRLEVVEKGEAVDWATAEMLGLGSLLLEGHPIRMSGQDTRRGTFSQRHSVLVDVKSGMEYTPLANLDERQAALHIFDSPLSEFAVLGFEYGYSCMNPQGLTAWEAQFGDFANGAQVIIDQFLASGEVKWGRPSGLVLLLPHGLEGQGAEHSSARLERWLQLSAADNWQVCYPTTPAQYFHLLRRQLKRPFRKPLVVMSPKSLLRHPRAVSNLGELSSGSFQEIMDDPAAVEAPRRVVLCTGKIYYELVERRDAAGREDIALLRLEQLYPFAGERIAEMLASYSEASQWMWVQEEPMNMGAWTFVQPLLQALIEKPLRYVGRKASSSPAVGYHSLHNIEQNAFLEEAVS